MNLDVHTILFISLVIDIVCTVVIALLWHYNHKRFHGMGFWVLDFAFQTTGILLISFRGKIPDLFSVVSANVLVISGAVLGYMGLERFFAKKGPQIQNGLLVLAFAGIHSFYTFAQPSLTHRNLLLAVSLLLVCGQCAWLLLRRIDPGDRPIARFLGIVFLIYCAVNLVQLFEASLYAAPDDLFAFRARESVFIIAYQVLLILVMYGMTLLVNLRLFRDLQLQEEKLYKAFHASPNAIILTRFQDGEILEVNDGFLALTGFTPGEVLGKKTLDLQLWADPEDRRKIVEALSREGCIHKRELKFRKKSGEILTGLFSAEIIDVNNQRIILSNIADITDIKKAEASILNLLTEKEILLREVHHRIKNNMNTMMSLLSLQSKMADNPHASEILDAARNRLMGMAHLYDRLYRSETYQAMSLKDFIFPLAGEIIRLFPVRTEVKLETAVEDIVLDPKILSPLGIIINELITNSLKHAFADREAGSISLSASRNDRRITILYSDDGPGIPESLDIKKAQGFGLELVSMLVEQIRGTIRFERGDRTRIIIKFEG
ncbi:PAS domain S-box protein, partial [bacterium]|nr:PAS domain S-box protein [bacterium]